MTTRTRMTEWRVTFRNGKKTRTVLMPGGLLEAQAIQGASMKIDDRHGLWRMVSCEHGPRQAVDAIDGATETCLRSA